MEKEEPSKVEEKKKDKSKVNKAKLYLEIITGMRGNHPRLVGWKGTFHVIEATNGNREVLREHADGVVSYVSENALISAVLVFCNTASAPKYQITNREASEIARMWVNMTPPIVKPLPVAFASDPGLTFHRLNFDLPESSMDKPKLFEEFLSRCTNRYALAAFIGSLFDPKADRQQYIWLHGYGRNGKGALTQFLRHVLGAACHSEVVPDHKPNQFWTSTFLGKRLVIFPECDQATFPSSALFKSMSGGDAIRIESKQKDAYSMVLDCKFMFLSNEELSISSNAADLRRAIYCHVGPITGEPDPDYYENLCKESPYILRECIDLYNQLCPRGGSIPCEDTAEAQAALDDEKYSTFFDAYFERGSPADFVYASSIQKIFDREKIRSGKVQGRFIQFWMREYNVKKIRQSTGDQRTWLYYGMKEAKIARPINAFGGHQRNWEEN